MPKRFLPRCLRMCAALLFLCFAPSLAQAQITSPRILSASPTDRFATLEEQLVNRLRATAEDQRNYLNFVVRLVKENKLDLKLVVAVERYALRRNPGFPFPFFERALRFEAKRRGIVLPPVRQFATTRVSTSLNP